MAVFATLRKLFLTVDDQAYLEAFVLVLAARLVVVCCFKRVAPWVLRAKDLSVRAADPVVEKQVGMALASVRNRVPWQANKICLPNAIAGKVMLARRGYPSTIHLGVGRPTAGELYAHAWLEGAGSIIVGEHSGRIMTRFERG